MISRSLISLIILFFVQSLFSQQSSLSPHGEKLNISCENCHNTINWHIIDNEKFNHDHTGFLLSRAHKKVKCTACHQNLVFNQVGVMCLDCHSDIHKGELGILCENCHDDQSWEMRSAKYEQHNQTNFPLIGVHAKLDCESCHLNEQGRQYITLSVECQSCHLGDYMRTLNPQHQKADFDLDCQNCHDQVLNKWEKAIFTHPLVYILEGAHKEVDCLLCHTNTYKGTDRECFSCHITDFQSTLDPNHTIFGFPTICEECHTTLNWERVAFDHFSESDFLIEGAHLNILCTDCHINNQVRGLSRECSGCHLVDFNAAQNPGHIENNFSMECLDCHNNNSWEPADFDHSNTQFTLNGAHIGVSCAGCHFGNYTIQLSAACFSCHEQNFNEVMDPNHNSNNY
jgi:hypothetical protein